MTVDAMKILERVKGAPQKDVPTITNDKETPSMPPAEVPVTRPPETTLKGREDSTPKEVSPPTDKIDYDFGETPKNAPERETPPSEDIDDIDRIVDIKGTSAENMKKLRTKLKSTHTELQTHKSRVLELEKKVTDYESGLIVPGEIQELRSRVDELQKYERIYKLEASPAYQQEISTPLNTTRGKLIDLAKQYEVPEEVLMQALQAEKVPEQNRILTEAFPDEISRLEAKSLIRSMKELEGKAVEYKQDAGKALARLHKQAQDRETEYRRQEIDGIVSMSRSAWVDSLSNLRADNDPAFTFREGDNQHNEVVRAILSKASGDVGKMVKMMGENGLKQLPYDLGYTLSHMTKLAHKSGLLQVQLDKALEELQVLRRRVGDLDRFNRPSANGGGRPTSTYEGTREKGAVGAARAALQKVTANR